MGENRKWSKGLVSRSARSHYVIGGALVTLIPMLAIAYCVLVERYARQTFLAYSPFVLIAVAIGIAAGYILLNRFPANILRLRRYTEELVSGKIPTEISLLKEMDDVCAIEHSMNTLISQLSSRSEELRRINEQLNLEIEERRRAEELKDEFVSTVSHELRTPLSITEEGISLLLDGIPGPINDKQKKVLLTSKGNIERLSRIINDLLDIAKIEAGRMSLHRERVDFRSLARLIATNMQPLAAAKGLQLEVDVTSQPLDVFIDADRIGQVLTNLVGNAVKFTDRGKVRVEARSKDGVVECEVQDTGIGMAEDDLPKLFNKFVQLKRSASGGRQGTGLGLAIAKNILELHGGYIRVASKEGEGSRFTFVMPFYSEEEVLKGRIDDVLAAAELTHREPGLYLIRVEPGDSSAQLMARLERTGLLKLFESKPLIRGADLAFARGRQEIVVLAEIEPRNVPVMLARWKKTITETVRGLDPEGHARISFGEARWPRDAACGSDLLGVAELNLVEAGSA